MKRGRQEGGRQRSRKEGIGRGEGLAMVTNRGKLGHREGDGEAAGR